MVKVLFRIIERGRRRYICLRALLSCLQLWDRVTEFFACHDCTKRKDSVVKSFKPLRRLDVPISLAPDLFLTTRCKSSFFENRMYQMQRHEILPYKCCINLSSSAEQAASC